MTEAPVCYGVRRLNPFLGMLQVVELANARALSPDGLRWEIQVLCAQPEHTWRSANRGAPVMRYHRVAMDQDGEPIELTYSIYRADRFEFVVKFRRGISENDQNGPVRS